MRAVEVVILFSLCFAVANAVLDVIYVNALIRDFWPADSSGVCTSIDKCGHTGLNDTQRFDCNEN
jgi:hypothetical protein